MSNQGVGVVGEGGFTLGGGDGFLNPDVSRRGLLLMCVGGRVAGGGTQTVCTFSPALRHRSASWMHRLGKVARQEELQVDLVQPGFLFGQPV